MSVQKKIQEYIIGGFIGKLNLSGEDMQHSNALSGLNIQGADLSYADLRNADLSGSDLRGANLKGANFSGASLINCNLSGADLREAILKYANLSGADLQLANLSNANLGEADLSNAKLKGVTLDHTNLENTVIDLNDIELDQDDDFYSDNIGDGEPECPYCNKKDACKHLFASFNVTFSELGSGYIFDRLDPLLDHIREFLQQHIKKQGFQLDSLKTNNLALDILWFRIVENYRGYSDFEEFEEICGDNDLIGFFAELIDPVDMDLHIEEYYLESGICCESLYKSVYSENPKKDFKKLEKYLKEVLESSVRR